MEENFTAKKQLIDTYGFTETDFEQINNHGVSLSTIIEQITIFNHGISSIVLDRPAKIDDGILKLNQEEFEKLASYFDANKSNLKIKKFVPASGAATRMFKFLNEFLNEFDHENESINAYINRKKDKNLPVFLAGIEKFPFYEKVKSKLKEIYPEYYSLESHEKSYRFIKTMLTHPEFNFGEKPKASLDFHKYQSHIATPIEEHLNECAYYASSNAVSNLHFTISENHRHLFENIIHEVKDKVEQKSNTKTEINFSYQDKSTDTIAVNLDNQPFRSENNELLFRPGGHGALINNLNQLDSDVIFIKNVDNVIQNHIAEISLYKKALAGKLIEIQSQIYAYLNAIDSNQVTEKELTDIVAFMDKKLNIKLYEGFDKYTFDNKLQSIKNKLNRPIRVCGMVINEGEPGGGPFWVISPKGNISLQIVESSQIDLENKNQLELLRASTHFNPVDLVCSIKNYQGEKFDLTQFIDHNAGFIVTKNRNGKEVKSYELPGLWNGAMAKWITVFVEVPLITFNPVKTVNDLLKPAHQPQYEN
ncbi:DUF4301 family protein [Flavobacterium capsici]|uniref:DUF4301 family protein n=1 Tax=Flavobacterium capsici TaxID=3075618 RepID=A0AA96J2S7_9FLAO|nr:MULTISPECIES: DUF4301 family protein [unclassified Flavobacterium]WNM19395.1 DUF4301 family protein [Flavobacterium sp. PMR2A8]WNM20785.1 DUF4301 family protein [Flavobacterium sp. PMTSA4]